MDLKIHRSDDTLAIGGTWSSNLKKITKYGYKGSAYQEKCEWNIKDFLTTMFLVILEF